MRAAARQRRRRRRRAAHRRRPPAGLHRRARVRAADGARRHHRDPGRAGADPPGSAQRGRQSAGHDGSPAPLARPGAVRRPAAAGAPLTHAHPPPPLPAALLLAARGAGACTALQPALPGGAALRPGAGAAAARAAGQARTGAAACAASARRRGWTRAGSRILGAGGQVDTEFYNEWTAPPVELVEEAMRQWLAACGLFAAVVSPGSRLRAGLVLEAELLRLQAEPRPGLARAGLAALLLDEPRDGAQARILGQFTPEGTAPLAGGARREDNVPAARPRRRCAKRWRRRWRRWSGTCGGRCGRRAVSAGPGGGRRVHASTGCRRWTASHHDPRRSRPRPKGFIRPAIARSPATSPSPGSRPRRAG